MHREFLTLRVCILYVRNVYRIQQAVPNPLRYHFLLLRIALHFYINFLHQQNIGIFRLELTFSIITKYHLHPYTNYFCK